MRAPDLPLATEELCVKVPGMPLPPCQPPPNVRLEFVGRASFLLGQTAGLPGKPDCPKTLDVGLGRLAAGLAWWYRKCAGEQSTEDEGRYEHAEFEAKIRRAALLSEANPVPPWECDGGRARRSAGSNHGPDVLPTRPRTPLR